MSQNSGGLKEGLLLLLSFPSLGGLLIGPLMIFWPVFLGVQWTTTGTGLVESDPTLVNWAISPLISLLGVAVTYGSMRVLGELDRGTEVADQDEMTRGYFDALDRGEVAGFRYVVGLFTSREVAWKVLTERGPERADGLEENDV